ncbi:MAG TPA: ABC transporter ATP-binding protein [Opitutaceae bacterium]|jgi:NitT/TauT family transport system ATP-binding protein|nr:ABC transporter ATP-binding protein [Opitutaceae bacterium]HRE05135.1 ABC transporter ATP-binding protein [Opitutaceae bacterium]
MPPIVEFKQVEKRYGEGPVILDRISFTAERGDFIALIGPSGCGKSTILKLISGLSPLSGGSVAVDGMEPDNALEELAFVFQEPTLLPWLTVQKNVEVPLRLRSTRADRRSDLATKSLALVGLSERAGYYPRQLSGGQKMRVSIARALSLSPKILLLDEPFGALDEMTRDHLNEELLAIREQKAWTAFFVTHSVAEAVFLSNRIFVLSANPGRLHREVAVDLPYPRTEETRQSARYQSLVAEVSKLLRSVERNQL